MWFEFKSFVMWGNIMDLVIGVVIGGVFGKIVMLFVEDIIMLFVGLFLGGFDFFGLVVIFGDVYIKYGSFI